MRSSWIDGAARRGRESVFLVNGNRARTMRDQRDRRRGSGPRANAKGGLCALCSTCRMSHAPPSTDASRGDLSDPELFEVHAEMSMDHRRRLRDTYGVTIA